MSAPITVKNTESGPTVFSDPREKIEIKWGGRNDKNGDDVQPVPRDLLDNVNFLKALSKGVLVILGDEDKEEALKKMDLQISGYRARKAEDQRVAEESIDHVSEQPITEVAIDDAGKITVVQEREIAQGEERGLGEESEIPVIIEPTQRGI